MDGSPPHHQFPFTPNAPWNNNLFPSATSSERQQLSPFSPILSTPTTNSQTGHNHTVNNIGPQTGYNRTVSVGPQIGYNRTVDNVGPFKTIEVVSIAIIILLLVSLLVYHCQKASQIEARLNETERAEGFKRTKMRKHHSFSRSTSFTSNLESVREVEEPEIFDTRLADKINEKEIEQKKKDGNTSPLSMEPWYKWLQQDSPEHNAQTMNKNHQSENDLNHTDDIEQELDLEGNGREIVGNTKGKFEPPIESYLITVSTKGNKRDEENQIPRSLSF